MVKTSVPAAKAVLANRPLPLPADGAIATDSDIAMSLQGSGELVGGWRW